jgi:hypothetical protein
LSVLHRISRCAEWRSRLRLHCTLCWSDSDRGTLCGASQAAAGAEALSRLPDRRRSVGALCLCSRLALSRCSERPLQQQFGLLLSGFVVKGFVISLLSIALLSACCPLCCRGCSASGVAADRTRFTGAFVVLHRQQYVDVLGPAVIGRPRRLLRRPSPSRRRQPTAPVSCSVRSRPVSRLPRRRLVSSHLVSSRFDLGRFVRSRLVSCFCQQPPYQRSLSAAALSAALSLLDLVSRLCQQPSLSWSLSAAVFVSCRFDLVSRLGQSALSAAVLSAAAAEQLL